MKKITALVLACIFTLSVTAQKVSKKGDLGELKGKSIQLVFDYSDIKIGKKKISEAKYIEKKVKETNKKEAGKGDQWKASWESDRPNRHEPKFLKLLNESCTKAEFTMDKADYIATVKTTFLEPGFNIGITRRDALVSIIVEFASASDPSKVIGTVTVLKATGKVFGGMDFDNGGRISEAYAKAGKALGKYLTKKALK